MSALPSKQSETTSDGCDTSAWEKLELTSTDPCRTTLTRATDGSEQYTVTTDESGSNPVTTYKDSSGGVVATLQWHRYSSDTLILEGREPKGLGKWLKVSKSREELTGKSKSGRKVTFEVDGHKYTWEGYQKVTYSPMELYADDAPDKVIAIFNPAPKPAARNQPDGRRANLLISNTAQQIRNVVVVSLLLIEKDRRFNGKSLRSSPYMFWDLSWLGAAIQAIVS